MLNIDLLAINCTSQDWWGLDEWLHVTPKIWGGLAVAAGSVTSVAVALTTTLPALSLGFTFAAVFAGAVTLLCTTQMLVGIGVQKIRNFLLEPAPTDFKTASTETLKIATSCVITIQVIAAICCGIACLILASLCLSLLLILPIGLYLAEIPGVLVFGIIMAFALVHFIMSTVIAADIQCNYEKVIGSNMTERQKELYKQLLTPGFSELTDTGRWVCRRVLNGTQPIDTLNPTSVRDLFARHEGLTSKDLSIILDLCGDLVTEISIDPYCYRPRCQGFFDNLVELDAAKYPNLRGLHLEGDIKLKCVKNLDKCKNLRWLSVCDCPSIQGEQPGQFLAPASGADTADIGTRLLKLHSLHTSNIRANATAEPGPIVVCTSAARTSRELLGTIGKPA